MSDARDHPSGDIVGRRFASRRVIVTGAARGIGAAIATAFHDEGARVAVVDHDAATTAAAEHLGAIGIRADLADPVGARTGIESAIAALDGVDALVNNAGVFASTPLLAITPDEWDAIFAINTRAVLLATQVAAKRMIADDSGGTIVNIASMGGKIGAAGQAHYAASKAAVISLTQVAARELGGDRIRVNAVCPGYVLTGMGASTRSREQVEAWCAQSPLGRLAEPADVAKMVLFLASDDAAYSTGQAVNVAGGMIMH